jgi:hypothetical protein
MSQAHNRFNVFGKRYLSSLPVDFVRQAGLYRISPIVEEYVLKTHSDDRRPSGGACFGIALGIAFEW